MANNYKKSLCVESLKPSPHVQFLFLNLEASLHSLLSFAWTLTHPTYLRQNIVFSYSEMIPVSSSFFPIFFVFMLCYFVIIDFCKIVLLSLIFFSKKINLICSCFVIGRYKSQTGSTRTASPVRINSDRLGPTQIE